MEIQLYLAEKGDSARLSLKGHRGQILKALNSFVNGNRENGGNQAPRRGGWPKGKKRGKAAKERKDGIINDMIREATQD